MADVAGTIVAEASSGRRRRRNAFLWVGVALLSMFIFIAIFGRAIAPYDPLALGVDEVGRDILSRILVGTRTTLLIAVVSVAIAGIFGVTPGVVSGYFGAAVRLAIQRAGA